MTLIYGSCLTVQCVKRAGNQFALLFFSIFFDFESQSDQLDADDGARWAQKPNREKILKNGARIIFISSLLFRVPMYCYHFASVELF